MNINEVGIIDYITEEKQQPYCSMVCNTDEEKGMLFSVINNPKYRLGDMIGETIWAKDFYAEQVICKNPETGEDSPSVRVVIIDTNGEGYQCVSMGIFNALKKLIMFYGQPTWENGIPLKIAQISKGNRRTLTFEVNYKAK